MEGAEEEEVRWTEKIEKWHGIHGRMYDEYIFFQLYLALIRCFRKVNIKRKILKSVKLGRHIFV